MAAKVSRPLPHPAEVWLLRKLFSENWPSLVNVVAGEGASKERKVEARRLVDRLMES